MIEIRNLLKKFNSPNGTELTVLDNISMNIEKGDICGIIGVSGAGKSTLLRLIGLLDTPNGGQVVVDGKNIFDLSGKDKIDYYRSIGTVFQGYNLLMQKTVFENVAFPLKLTKYDPEEVKQKVNSLLEIVGLIDKADSYPSKLSGGQRQRVAIARALANDPQILLCDEPTSALDSINTQAILNLLKDINERLNVTIIIITHDIGVVKKICNKVAVLESGHLVDSGKTCDVENNHTHSITSYFFGKETK